MDLALPAVERLNDWRSALLILKPETVIAWHRMGFRRYWSWKSRRREGRPTIGSEGRNLIRQMSLANPRWGAPRVHGELLRIGIELSQATVAKYMVRHHKPPSQTWRTFLENHVRELVSADFFVVPTVFFKVLFVFVILADERRRPVHVAMTEYATAEKRLCRAASQPVAFELGSGQLRFIVPGDTPMCRLNARLKAASDS